MDSEIIYGPVASWRLSRSLGVDIICSRNICTFDCIYCQLGPSEENTTDRRVFVETEEVISAVQKALPQVKDETDVLTLSGTGEPSLALNFGEIIDELHRVANFPVAVLTNGTLLHKDDVRREMKRADIVVGSLDAGDERTWRKINRPHQGLDFSKLIEGMKTFSREYEGFFALEVMLMPQNQDSVGEISRLAAEISPDEVQINTPRRGDKIEVLTPEEIETVEEKFAEKELKIRSVYKAEPPEIRHFIGKEKLEHLKRSNK